MSVFVDSAFHQFGRMKMCHMLADTPEELHDMAAKIGVARRWVQHAGTHKEHYDICMAARKTAVSFGAVVIDSQGIGRLLLRKRGAA